MSILALFISVFLELLQDGTAAVTETWDIDCTSGTEIYLVRKNLGDIEIYDFAVSDNGSAFVLEDGWNTKRSLEQKAGRCGMQEIYGGYELCWGIGSYGHHSYVVSYKMSNAVKSLNDYDALHLQPVSPGLNPVPDEVTVIVKAPVKLDQTNSLIWGFGYKGSVTYTSDGCVRFSNDGGSFEDCSVISLIRFDKGIFDSPSVQDRDFSEILEIAQEGDDFEEDDGPAIAAFLSAILASVLLIFGIAGLLHRKRMEDVLGCNVKDIDWCRDIPFEGDILQSYMVLEQLGMNRKSNVAGAMILRMIYNGIICLSKDDRGNVEMSFDALASLDSLNSAERSLYDMMKKASGSDVILQKNEFRRWSRFHTKEVSDWAESIGRLGRERARETGNIEGRRFTLNGQKNSRNLVGLKNFLGDYTLLKERGTAEVVLWKEYLVFAALFGIADKVAKELEEINPGAFEQQLAYDPVTINQTLYVTRNMAEAITNARISRQAAAAARSGRGGMSSFGGGGGFSGGGFGGGVR